MINTANISNLYWEAVRGEITYDPFYKRHAVGEPLGDFKLRDSLTTIFSWAISDPATVEFVAGACGTRVVDPMAGTGYWAYLLRQAGAIVNAYDATPVSVGANDWHPNAPREWFPVKAADAVSVVRHFDNSTLLLCWPPHLYPAADILRAYPGDRVVFMGDTECCGDEAMVECLKTEWRLVDEHTPLQWFCVQDTVSVYERP